MKLAVRVVSGAVLALAMVSVPASARSYRGYHGGYHGGYHDRHHGGRIGTVGGILLGALALGTVAAIASDNRRDRYSRSYAPTYGGGYGGYGGYSDNSVGYGGYSGYSANDAYDDQYARADPRAVPPPAYGDIYADEPNGYDRATGSSDPVDDCSRAAERQAQNGGGYARVVGIDRVDQFEGGANIRGRLEIDNGRSGPVRRMSFSCSARFGEVTQLRFG